MKKMIVVVQLLGLLIFSCHSQERNKKENIYLNDTTIKKTGQLEIPINTKTMEAYTNETFDIQNYLKHRNNEVGVYEYYASDDSKVVETDIDEYAFFRSITPKNSLFTIQKEYYKEGYLKTKWETYGESGFIKGNRYEYNERGKLIKVEDWDKPFKFTWEQVKSFCEQELKLDLLKNEVGVDNNYMSQPFPTWRIDYIGQYKGEGKRGLISITLNGTTGELMKVTRQLGKGGEGSILEIIYEKEQDKKDLSQNQGKEKKDGIWDFFFGKDDITEM